MTVLRRTTRATAAGHHEQHGSGHEHIADSSKEGLKKRAPVKESSSGHPASTTTTTTATTSPLSATPSSRKSAGGSAEIIDASEDSMPTTASSSNTLRKGKARERTSGRDAHAVAAPMSAIPDVAAATPRTAARSSSRRRHAAHETVQEGADEQHTRQHRPPQLHAVPDNVMQAQGLSAISTALIDTLPDCAFPKKGVALHPGDQNDPLLVLCGKVLASVSNRALTPKEIALILARRHGWQFNGSQPFAVVSSCIRSHVRRASLAQPPYSPIFTPYELSSVPPAEDIPCLGIESDSKPAVKRGTFWFLSESMGYGYPFPHRRAASTKVSTPEHPSQPLSTVSPTSAITHPSTSSTPQALPAAQNHHRRSSLRHQPPASNTPTQPIPIMPAPPQHTTSFSSLPALAPRTKSEGETDRLTRAQKTAQSSRSTSMSAGDQQQQIYPSAASKAQGGRSIADPSASNAGKRKRTISKALQQAGVPTSHAAVSDDTVKAAGYPHLQQLPEGANAAVQPNNQSIIKMASNLKKASKKSSMATKRASGGSAASSASSSSTAAAVHTRAFSSSAGDVISARPVPALRKLKLRLSAVSEYAVLDGSSSPASTNSSTTNLLSSSLPASGLSVAKKVTLVGGKPSASSSNKTKQPKNKRARTQSMSHQTNTTASFPFDDLHLYHSMQQPSLDHYPSPFDHHPNGQGTLYPLEMHMQYPQTDLLLTSKSAPEGSNLFSPSLAAAAAANPAHAAQHIAGPFSRSHSPSASMHHYLTGRRSLPPPSDYEIEDESSHLELEYDGWGMDSDHQGAREIGGTFGGRGGVVDHQGRDLEDSFHEAMLKNDELDFEFDFSLGSLGQSASRHVNNISTADSNNLSLEEENHRDASAAVNSDGGHDEEGKRSRKSMSILEALAVDSILDGLNAEEEDDSHATVQNDALSKGKRPSLGDMRASSGTADDSSMMEEDELSLDLEEEEEEDDGEGNDDTGKGSEAKVKSISLASRTALLERRAYEKALNTTLCPAAAKLGEGSSSHKSPRLQLRRINSSSSLSFSRSNNPSLRMSETLSNHHHPVSSSPLPNLGISASANNNSPLLRPPSVSRMNSKDVLTSAVPLVELPSIPLEDSRRDSFLFHHLTLDADPPSYFGDAYKSSPRSDEQDLSATTTDGQDDIRDDGSTSSPSSDSLLRRTVKSEEEMDGIADMQAEEMENLDGEIDEDDNDHDDDDVTARRDISRCCSTASAMSRAELESNDSFNPEMIYPIVGRRAPSADLGNIGGQGELEQVSQEVQLHNSRSQSSSRTTSLSPRDSFSPHMVHHHGESYSSEVDADWALTPPSEEEHVDEDEKNLDRATMLGLESVGMEDLDDVWPGVRRSLGGIGSSPRISENNLEAQVDGVTSGFKVMEVFEPVLSAAPIPQCDLPSPHLFTLPTLTTDGTKLSKKGEEADETITLMEIDQTPMDEHTAAAMFIADESLHPPKPAPSLTITAPTSEAGDLDTPRPSLSPVSAATRDAATTADAQASTSSAINVLQKEKAAAARSAFQPTQSGTTLHSDSPQQAKQQRQQQSASTQSFLFYPEKPFHPEISILLTDTKILFYSTIVNIPKDGRPLLRRVDNDAVDAEALLLSLEGCDASLDSDRIDTLRKIKELGNTWVSLDFARELLSKFGGVDPLLGIFLADDILLAWNEKLVKLGSMLRQKNGLPTPVADTSIKASTQSPVKNKILKTAKEPAKEAMAVPSTSTAIAEKALGSPEKSKPGAASQKQKDDVDERMVDVETVPAVESKSDGDALPVPSSSPAKKEKVKFNLARRASSRIKPAGS